LSDLLERTRFLEQVRRPGNDYQLNWGDHPRNRLLVQLDYDGIAASDDE
jgi:hypothetical protein